MAIKGVPTNPPGMRRRQTAHRPSQAYEIDLLVDGAWKLVGYSEHPETAKGPEYWTFTSVQGDTWTQQNDRHFFGMARLKEEYGISMQLAGAALAGQARAEAAEAEGLPVGGRHEDDPLLRAVIEGYAVDRARKWLQGQGWVCGPLGKPFDLRCTKGGQELHVEVKGTRGKGTVVELTRNEVIHNQQPCTWETACDKQALFVVSEITLTGQQPEGGKMGYAWPWKITSTVQYDHDSELIPTKYDYTVPELTMVPS
jgi:Domain of unknown function (DUF3883)